MLTIYQVKGEGSSVRIINRALAHLGNAYNDLEELRATCLYENLPVVEKEMRRVGDEYSHACTLADRITRTYA